MISSRPLIAPPSLPWKLGNLKTRKPNPPKKIFIDKKKIEKKDKNIVKSNLFVRFDIAPTIRIGQEIQCLPYAVLFFLKKC